MTLNLWLRPTSVFDNAEETDFVDASKNPIIAWHNREGLAKGFTKVRDEFKLYRGLQTVKSVILGPSGCGKTPLAKQVAQKYKIPHI